MDAFLSSVLARLRSRRSILSEVLRLRHAEGIHDLRRGEVYEEIIATERAFRQVAAKVYELGEGPEALCCVQPNFGANGCIDSVFSLVREEEVHRGAARTGVGGMLIVTPTYARYLDVAAAKGIDCRVVRALEPHYPLARVLEQIRIRPPSILVVVSPNNPTGVSVSEPDIVRLRQALGREPILLIDRACVTTREEPSTVELLKKLRGTRSIVIHSLSKYFHLSHLRFGFSICADYGLGSQMKHHCPLGSELEAALVATEALETRGPIAPLPDVVDTIRENGALMEKFCEGAGLSAFNLTSSFAVLRLPPELPSTTVCERLGKRKVLVMGAHEFPGEPHDWLRVHLGSPRPSIEALIAALQAVI